MIFTVCNSGIMIYFNRDIKDNQFEFNEMKPGKSYVLRITAVGEYEKSAKSEAYRAGAREKIFDFSSSYSITFISSVFSTHFTGYPAPELTESDRSSLQVFNIAWNSFTVTLPEVKDAVSLNLILKTDGKIYREIK